uniref:Uncharacterized protein n=1 Tax=Arundo donax TaxID=35708 RepID=A0A0A8Y516_ARUDO
MHALAAPIPTRKQDFLLARNRRSTATLLDLCGEAEAGYVQSDDEGLIWSRRWEARLRVRGCGGAASLCQSIWWPCAAGAAREEGAGQHLR